MKNRTLGVSQGLENVEIKSQTDLILYIGTDYESRSRIEPTQTI